MDFNIVLQQSLQMSQPISLYSWIKATAIYFESISALCVRNFLAPDCNNALINLHLVSCHCPRSSQDMLLSHCNAAWHIFLSQIDDTSHLNLQDSMNYVAYPLLSCPIPISYMMNHALTSNHTPVDRMLTNIYSIHPKLPQTIRQADTLSSRCSWWRYDHETIAIAI